MHTSTNRGPIEDLAVGERVIVKGAAAATIG